MNRLNPAGDWLSQMSPDRTPAPPGWWPPAPGWWLIAVLLLASSVVWIVWLRRPERRQRQTALRELNSLPDNAPVPDVASRIEDILRRFALARFGAAHVARLSGQDWLRFLIDQGAHDLSGEAGATLLAAAYGGRVADMRTQWLAGARDFISHAGRRRRLP
jgi:hypothetical protein